MALTSTDPIKERMLKAMHYLMALVFVLDGYSTYLCVEPLSAVLGFLLYFMVVFITICSLLLTDWLHPTKQVGQGFLVCLVLLAYLLIFVAVSDYNQRGALKLAMIGFAICVYYFSCNNRGALPELLNAYKNLVTVLAGFSLVCWLFCSVLKIIPPTGTIGSGWVPGGVTFNNYGWLYFEPQTAIVFGRTIIRNCGVFIEAPMASFCYTTALLIQLFLTNKRFVAGTTILFLSVASTFSTTGTIITIGAIILKLVISAYQHFHFHNKYWNKKWITILMASVLLITGGIIAIRLIRIKIAIGTGNLRIDDFIAGYKAWMDHILIGNGVENRDAIIQYMSEWRLWNTGISNSLAHILSDGGMYLGVLYIVPFISNAKRALCRRKYGAIAFTVCYFFMFAVTIYTYRCLTFYMLAYLAFNNGTIRKSSGSN